MHRAVHIIPAYLQLLPLVKCPKSDLEEGTPQRSVTTWLQVILASQFSLRSRKTMVLIPLSIYSEPTHTWGQETLWESCYLTSSASSIPFIHGSWHLGADYVTNDVTLLVHPCNFMDDNTKSWATKVSVRGAQTTTRTHTHVHVCTHTTQIDPPGSAQWNVVSPVLVTIRVHNRVWPYKFYSVWDYCCCWTQTEPTTACPH